MFFSRNIRINEFHEKKILSKVCGYFAFIYPDELIKDPLKTIKERCSRRLAVMLNLKNGRQSSFDDVLNVFYKEYARRLQKYLHLMPLRRIQRKREARNCNSGAGRCKTYKLVILHSHNQAVNTAGLKSVSRTKRAFYFNRCRTSYAAG